MDAKRLTQADWEPWFAGTEFTTDWATRAFPTFSDVFRDERGSIVDILEVGVWEGRSSVFFLEFFSGSRITAVDIFMLGNEGLFDRNVRRFGERVEKLRSRSVPCLDALYARQRRSFDLIYLDGSHNADDVALDTVLAWRLLRVGGYLIWDDYEIFAHMSDLTDPGQDPKPPIDAFLASRAGDHEIVHSDYQLIVRKLKPHFENDLSRLDPGGAAQD